MTDDLGPKTPREGRPGGARPAGRRPSVRRPKPPRRRGRRRGWLVVMVLLAAALGAWWWFSGREVADDSGLDFGPMGALETDAGAVAGDRAITVVFPEWDASGYVTEQRQITSRDRPGEDLLGIMRELCDGPRISGAVSALPAGTRALGAFVDRENAAVVVDFSSDLVTGHPGGSAAEVATLTSILRTVALNFPDTRSCVILVEGAQIETMAGHLDLVRPFDPRGWL